MVGGRVSWSEVVSSCIFSILLVSIRTGCVRLSGDAQVSLDSGTWGEVRSRIGKYRLFHQHDDGLAFAGCLRTRYEAFSRSVEPFPDQSLAQRPQKRRDSRKIPGQHERRFKDS